MYLTENEHYCVQSDFEKKAEELGLNFLYHRKLKEGHVPMFREMKFVGEKEAINRFKKFLTVNKYTDNMKKNPHKMTDQEYAEWMGL